MLAGLGLFVIVALLTVIMTKRMSPLAALITIPIAASLVGGFGLETGTFVTDGLRNIAPVMAMFVFAILFFGAAGDAGLFDPIVDRILPFAGARPQLIVACTALLAMVVHLDGSGASTFLIAVPAMLPLYERLSLDRRLLACAVAMGAGVMNVLPWGGPLLRAAAALKLEMTDLFNPLLPALGAGIACVMGIAYFLGKREAARLGLGRGSGRAMAVFKRDLSGDEKALRRPGRYWLNFLLALMVIVGLVSGLVPPAIPFMVGTVLVLWLNYPDLAEQKRRIDAHAGAALMMASILLAAGVLTGILEGSGMLAAMASAAAEYLPQSLARHAPVALGVLSVPLSLFFDPDSFYFGVLPVVAEVAQGAGVEAAQVARGALLGQTTVGFPVSPLTPSTFLLVGLAQVNLADHQRFTLPWLWATSIVMTAVSVAVGAIPL
jgi:CitMHS family citrate-Mg2+:H+ or citrate-Ca2+:H+ symporter